MAPGAGHFRRCGPGDLSQVILVVELFDRRQLAGPSVGKKEADIVKVHADGRQIAGGRTVEDFQRGLRARININVNGNESDRRSFRKLGGEGLNRLLNVAPGDLSLAV